MSCSSVKATAVVVTGAFRVFPLNTDIYLTNVDLIDLKTFVIRLEGCHFTKNQILIPFLIFLTIINY